jgi:hypothetical protein
MHRLFFALTMVALFFVGYCSSGCASTPMDRARTVLAQTDNATHLVDGVLRARYAAVSASGDADAIRRYNRTLEATYLTHASLMAAELLLDDVEDMGDERRIGAILGCVTARVLVLVERIQEMGEELPDVLVMLLGIVQGVASASCDPTEHVSLPSAAGQVAVP